MGTRLMEPGRVGALTDGIFAIAITLLVIEIAVPLVAPEEGTSGLIEALQELWPSFLAYLLGFLAIGIWWLDQHSMFTTLRAVNHTFLVLNIVFLATIAFVPFTSALLAEYMGADRQHQMVAVVGFAAWQLVAAIVYNITWNYASRQPRLLRADVDPASLAKTVRWNLVLGPTVWGVTILIALANSTVAVILIFIGGIVWLVWSGVPPAREPLSP